MMKISTSKLITSYKELKPDAKLLILISFIGNISSGIWSFCLPLYLLSEGYSFTSIGWIGGIGGFANVLMLFFTPFIVNKFGKRIVLVAGFALELAGMSVFLFWINLWIYIAGQVLLNIGSALIGPVSASILSDIAPAKEGKYAFALTSFSGSF
ncbi:MAG: MFS transporter, partial [Thermoplasmata archaeon]